MKKLLIILSIVTSLLFSAEVFAKSKGNGGHVHVNGYTRKDGTYVQPHYRTAPDGIKTNNWSHSGNVNPYTGKVGTNTDSTPNARASTPHYGNAIGGYNYTPPSIALPNNDYTTRYGELHNHRTASYYTD
jgi:hypothetical protein